ncbi:MAG: CFI-box-CTERM domain-containing protein [Nitrosopumilus sp.]
MKMRFRGLFVIMFLSISVLFYGASSSVFADNHDIPPISASTELPAYENGDRVIITGNIRDFDSSVDQGKAITIVVKSPSENIVGIDQVVPNSDGTFTSSKIIAGGIWNTSGDYIAEINFDGQSAQLIVVYIGGEFVPTTTVDPEPDPICGPGTVLENGICVVASEDKPDDGGGCLIATAAYGTELAPQVQFLREIRDNQLMNTQSGAAFMTGFNQLYYSFSPTIADMERENPLFQEAVRAFITPMISTLSIMTLADDGSESKVLGLGISVIMLNLSMYVAIPALVGFKVHKYIQSRK